METVISRARYYGKMALMAEELWVHLDMGESCGILAGADRAPTIFAWAIEVMKGRGVEFTAIDHKNLMAHRKGGGSIEMLIPRGPRLLHTVKGVSDGQ